MIELSQADAERIRKVLASIRRSADALQDSPQLKSYGKRLERAADLAIEILDEAALTAEAAQ